MKKLHPRLSAQLLSFLSREDRSRLSDNPIWDEINKVYVKAEDSGLSSQPSPSMSSVDEQPSSLELAAVLQTIPDEFVLFDQHGTILRYEGGIRNLFTPTSGGYQGKNIETLLTQQARSRFMEALHQVRKTQSVCLFEIPIRREDNDEYFEVRILPMDQSRCIALIRDISEQKAYEQQTSYLAFHDSLTGLPNRLMFQDRLRQSIAHARRTPGMFAVMFLDLDRFKQINDTLGHSAGDELLITIANRLRYSLRESDTVAVAKPTQESETSKYTIARLGGDEFTLILNGISGANDVTRVARRILHEVARPLHVANHDIYTSASIGIALYPYDGEDVETLVKNADAAMYHAKEKGRNNFQLYSKSMNAAALQRMRLENSLRQALQQDNLQVYYQPLFDLVTGKIQSYEALLRWNHPKYGMISPKYFVPLAEESDLIDALGKWVLRQVSQHAKQWEREGRPKVPISVNVSGHQLRDDRLLHAITSCLQEFNLKGNQLAIEITESNLMKNPEVATYTLRHLQEMGIWVTFDDFGTGYSSLSYLKRFSPNSIKIDQSFISDLFNNSDNNTIFTKTLISMGNSLGMQVIAEGIDTETQLQFLQEHGCHSGQGFHLCPPLPPHQLIQFIEAYQPHAFPIAHQQLFGVKNYDIPTMPNLTPLPKLTPVPKI